MRLSVTKEQMEFLETLGVEDRDYTREEIDDYVIETVYEHLMKKGWKTYEPDYEINDIGIMCEDIIDTIEEQR